MTQSIRTWTVATLAALSSIVPRSASADVSSWLYAGGGATDMRQVDLSERRGTMQLEVGVGSSAESPLVLGGMAKTLTFFGRGSDLVLAARLASSGFCHGGFGLALDAGGYQRFWGESSSGFSGAVALGAPFGLQFSLLYELGRNDVRDVGATVGFDFLRLTVHRTAGQNWWPNPAAAFYESAPAVLTR